MDTQYSHISYGLEVVRVHKLQWKMRDSTLSVVKGSRSICKVTQLAGVKFGTEFRLVHCSLTTSLHVGTPLWHLTPRLGIRNIRTRFDKHFFLTWHNEWRWNIDERENRFGEDRRVRLNTQTEDHKCPVQRTGRWSPVIGHWSLVMIQTCGQTVPWEPQHSTRCC